MKAKLLLLLLLANFSIYAQTNLVANGGLNSWSGASLYDWTVANNVSSALNNYEGKFSAKLSYVTASPEITTQVPLQAGVTYTIKFKYMYLDSNYGGDHPISLNISKNGSATTLSSNTFAKNNAWTEKEATFTPDANLSYDLSISTFSFDSAAFSVLIDHVQVYVAGTEQYTQIPDINFENKLIALGIDSGLPDGKVQTSNIATITSLDVSSSNITDLTGIEDFVSLSQLYVMSNKLTTLDLSKNPELTIIRCDANYTITSLNLSNNPKLNYLYCGDNKITSLDLSNLPELIELYCNSNQLSSLNLSANTKLENLYAYSNLLTALDLSKNTALINLYCYENMRLETLNLQNGNNNLIQKIALKSTPSLYCFVVDDIAYSTTNWSSFKDANVNFTLTCQAPEYILIPDPEFEKSLLTSSVDGVVDGKVLKSKVLAAERLYVNLGTVTDLTGIESFTNLKSLEFTNGANSKITKIDLSPYKELNDFTCRSNNFTEINVSQNLKLKELSLNNNKLTKIDVTSNLALEKLSISINKISELNVTNNKALKSLSCSDNPLAVIDVSQNIALQGLDCLDTEIKSLDVTNNPALQFLNIERNDLKILDVSKNLQLTSLNCDQNQLKSLDISKNTLLTKFTCGYNYDLAYLNVKNGNNKNFITNTNNYRGFINTKLTCIEVDDVDYSNANWANLKDAKASYSSSCDASLPYTLIPDSNFEDALIALKIDNDGKNGKVLTSSILTLTSLNVSNSNIKDLTGIEDFVSLTSLDCSNNNLSELNLTENMLIGELRCNNNNLFTLDVSRNTRLTTLSASFNKIVTLDLSTNKSLKEVDCASNNLHNLNLKNGNNANMQRMIFGNFTENPKLACIEVDDAAYSDANWIAKDATANYSTQACALNEQQTLIPDPSFERILIAQGIDNDGENGKVRTLSISALNSLSLNDSTNKVSDLTGIQDFRALTTLRAGSNNLKTVDLSQNTELIILELNDNQLTDIDLSNNPSLWSLSLRSNKLTTLDVSTNLQLGTLHAEYNQLTTVDFFKNSKLTGLYLGNNKIKEIDLSQNTKLTYFSISSNSLTSLDLSNNLLLTGMSCSENQITTLDLSKNNKLSSLNVSSNKLYNLNLNNGANSLITNISNSSFKKNPYLTCIQVDNVAFSDTTWSTIKDETASFSSVACPNGEPFTLIPDVNFENKLIALGIDKDGTNGKVATYSIDKVTSLNVSKSAITDLTGLQDFTALTSLEATDNKLTTINVAKNLLLTNLNVSKNQLTNVDVSTNNKLVTLNCSTNAITALNISNNLSLSNLNCSNNVITTLDVSRHLELSNLNCSTNALTVLNVSKNTKLTILSASINNLEDLDISKNTLVKEIDCAGNNLYNLNLKNGNNVNMERVIFGNFTENPNLLCIQVDDATFSKDNWIAKDATATYSSDACPLNGKFTLIPDINFEKLLIEKGIDKDGENGQVLTASISGITQLNTYDSKIKVLDLTGIQDFSALETLNCSSASLTNLDLTKNVNLTTLDCSHNKLTSLDLSKNIKLKSLNFSGNALTTTDFSANVNLTSLTAYDSQLTTIDLSKNTALLTLGVYDNKLTSLDVSANVNLTTLAVSNNLLTSLDISANTKLTAINVSENQLTTLDVSNNTLLTSMSAYSNKFENLNTDNNTLLTNLDLRHNKIETIDVSKNAALIQLTISDNKLTTFDITKNTALSMLMLNNNQLTSLNLKNGKNNLIISGYLDVSANPKLTCILVDDVTYANTNWSNGKDAIAKYNTECTGELVLPSNNFAIETKGESCLGENNGEISIVAKNAFAYTATINDKAYAFTNNTLKVASLTPGIYQIKITIPEMIFEQNFTVTILKGATITGKSSTTGKKVDVEITEGTAPFTIYIDGTEQFQTTDTNFSLDLTSGGLLEVATSKACEGTFSKKIASSGILGTLAAYPNPTLGNFEIEIPTDKTQVKIELYNIAGQLVSNKIYTIENGKAQLNLDGSPSGIYAAKIYLETPEYLKIIKK